MNAYTDQLRGFLASLSGRQRATLAAAALAGVLLVGAVGYWASRPDYALLFGGLDASSAAQVVESLQAQNVPYQLREAGTAVYVPREQVYEQRLRLASSGAVSDGQTGYELFDKGTLGMTDFMQKVSYKRALEGELARTITGVRGVEAARVHLVLPERNPFRENQVSPSASVVLRLAHGGRPDRERVAGITALVSGAVEGLEPADVTVVDAQGTLLSDPATTAADGGALSASQLSYQRAIEEHLAAQGQSMLDRVLGSGRAIVRVSATVDFSKTVTEAERIDPESATVLSEERVEADAAGVGGSSVRNFELTRERERSERGAGRIEYLTVSVILDQRTAAPAAEGAEPTRVPFTDEELAEISALVRNAVGFNDARGDRIAVHQTQFDTTGQEAEAAEWQAVQRQERTQLYLRYGLMALALLVGAWLLRAATARVVASPETPGPEDEATDALAEGVPSGDGLAGADAPALVAGGAPPEEEDALVPEDFYTSRLSPEARRQLGAKRKFYEATQQRIAENPEEAAALIGTWLAEDRVGLN